MKLQIFFLKCLYDYATHVINLIQFTVGSPESVGGVILKNIYSSGVDDAVYASLYMQDGVSGQLAGNLHHLFLIYDNPVGFL